MKTATLPQLLSTALGVRFDGTIDGADPQASLPPTIPAEPMNEEQFTAAITGVFETARAARGQAPMSYACLVHIKVSDVLRTPDLPPLSTRVLTAISKQCVTTLLETLKTPVLPGWAVRTTPVGDTAEFLQRVALRHRDGQQVPSALLDAVLNAAGPDTIRLLLTSAVKMASAASPHDTLAQEPALAALFNMARGPPPLASAVGSLCRESATAIQTNPSLAGGTGNLLAVPSVLLPLLRVSALAPEMEQAMIRDAYGADPRAPRARDNISAMRSRSAETVQRYVQVLHDLLRAGLKLGGETRQHVLDWLVAMVRTSEMRLRVRDQTLAPPAARAIAEGHGPAINFARLLLLLAEPVLRNPDTVAASDLSVWVRTTRFECEDKRIEEARKAASEKEYAAVLNIMIAEQVDEEVARQLHQALQLSLAPAGPPMTLATEIFFTTLRGLHTCLLPALAGYEQLMQILHMQLNATAPNTPDHARRDLAILSAHDRWDMALFDLPLCEAVSNCYLAVAQWLARRVAADSTDAALDLLPDFIVKDLALWIGHMARISSPAIRPPAVPSASIRPLVELTCALLERPALVPGAIVTARLISMLRSLIEPARGEQASQATGRVYTGDGPLAMEVLGHPHAQARLGPALLRAYVAIDMVVGLDVDKEEFEKYGVKHDMARLLRRLWVDDAHRSAMVREAPTAAMRDFALSLLESLLFVSGGCFDVIRKIKVAETAGDPATSPEFEKNIHFARGSLSSTIDSLTMLSAMTSEPAIRAVFCSPRLARNTASLINHFLAKLAGPQRSDFTIAHTASVGFEPLTILVQVAILTTRLMVGEHASELLVALRDDVEYAPEIIATLVDTVSRSTSMLLTPADRVTLSELPQRITSAVRATSAPASALSPTTSTSAPAPGAAAAARGVVSAALEAEYESALRPLLVTTCSFRTGAKEPSVNDEDEDDDDDDAEAEYEHDFRAAIAQSTGAPAKARRLMKELQELPGNLPLHPNAAIFVRFDKTRPDIVRALISGPSGTPYEQGLFLFDIFCPDGYPEIAPLVKFLTTGQGRVRFNPNLYNDGKVCLSLLGTFHGGDATQKWDPAVSSLYQVLVSIQGMILVEQPIFNEPGTPGQGTPEGDRSSDRYNAPLRESTMKFAMLAMLRQPPHGFAEVVRRHFRINAGLVVATCQRWIAEAAPDAKPRMADTLALIQAELAKLT